MITKYLQVQWNGNCRFQTNKLLFDLANTIQKWTIKNKTGSRYVINCGGHLGTEQTC